MYQHHKSDFIWGILAGGALATLFTLLYTTKKGKQIQKEVSDLYDEIETTVKDALDSSKEKIVEAAEHIVEAAEHAAEKVVSKPKHTHGHGHSKDKG